MSKKLGRSQAGWLMRHSRSRSKKNFEFKASRVYTVPGQSVLHKETLSQKQTKTKEPGEGKAGEGVDKAVCYIMVDLAFILETEAKKDNE